MRISKHKLAEQREGEIRAFRRLHVRKKDKPYYERYYTLYILAIIFGWSANILSGITESSKIYAFFYGFLAPYSFANVATWGLVIIAIILLEMFHRVISRSYFKDLVENDTHTVAMTPKLVVMLSTALCLTSLSFLGSFDLIRLSQEQPKPVIAQTVDAAQINNSIGAIADSLNADADEYRATRKWKNRLSTEDTKEWKIIQQDKRDMQKLQAQALLNIGQINKENQIQADSLNAQRQLIYESKINQKGYGLGFIAIIAMCVLYLCLWYDEEYQERKMMYLEKKYGHLFESVDHSPTPEEMGNIFNSAQPPIEGSGISSLNGANPNSTKSQNEHSPPKTPENNTRNPIGFFKSSKNDDLDISTVHKVNSSGQAWTDLDRVYLDQHTVPHTYHKGGKPVTVHYTLRMVNSRIGQYERDIQDALNRNLADDILQNRKAWLVYWQSKKAELLNKI